MAEPSTGPTLPSAPSGGPARSGRWRRYLRVQYRFIRLLDPVIRLLWHAGALGITGELEVVGRRTGRRRRVLLGIIQLDGRRYVGHPNGEVSWTSNLLAAGTARLIVPGQASVPVTSILLEPGPERTAVIIATAHQQPFPGNVVYRLARRHILAVGRYFRLEDASEAGRPARPGR
jgi:hypothetical protein